LTEKEEVVANATEEDPAKKKVSKKKLARQKEKNDEELDIAITNCWSTETSKKCQ
jgi:hypothetical protein